VGALLPTIEGRPASVGLEQQFVMAIERNLILVHQPYRQNIKDFHDIAQRAEQMAPDVRAVVVNNGARHAVERKKAAELPTLVFSPGALDEFRPVRGKIYAGQFVMKAEQGRRFMQAGLPTPATVSGESILTSLPELTDLILVKPDHERASNGRGIQLRRRTDFEIELSRSSGAERESYVVQSYIDTGPYPINYRVHTLFGETLIAYKKTSTLSGPMHTFSDSELRDAIFQPRVGAGHTVDVCRECDVLDLARNAYAAMPEIPLQGCDIVRDCKTGQLYILEINAGGNTWVFSKTSPNGRSVDSFARKMGVADIREPFDAFNVAARVLVEKARQEAI
jgi:hypothetical protein